MRRLALVVLAGLGAISSGPAFGGVFDPDIHGTGMTMAEYMVPVTGGGQPGGPVYAYCMGKFEITNQQFCDFLNDAEADANSGAPTGRSSNMFFAPNGSVCLDSSLSMSEAMFRPHGSASYSDIRYDPVAPMGTRYRPVRDSYGDPKSKHAARRISWLGAVKFCNWLTLDQGLGEENRCYTEGPDIGDWHPVVISTEDWWGKEPAHDDRVSAGRNLDDAEREELVRNYRGYRLPMDDAPLLAPNNRPDPNDFNEWLKAAAWDPDAPDTLRTNAGGWQAVPDHWMYGFGREDNTAADANWRLSGDPWDDDEGTTPVDYYDGTDHGGTFQTNDTNNRYGLYDMAGNVWEWGQGYGVNMENRAVYGGSWVSTPERQAASSCYYYSPVNFADVSFGFRILQVACPVEVKVTASDAQGGDEFGRTVSISGDRAISGAHFDDLVGSNSGSAYVYARNGVAWIEEAKLVPADGEEDDHFGHVVAISGDYAVIGAPLSDDDGNESGSAYIFERDETDWTQTPKLTAGADAEAGDRFGYGVAVSGDYAFVGAYSDDDQGSAAGAVYVFKREATGWTRQQKLLASDGTNGDYFGYSVSASGDYLLIGAYGDDDTAANSGSAYVFRRDGASWIEEDKLHASDPEATDGFGLSVSINGDYAVVGAPWNDDAGNVSGSAYVFKRDGIDWAQQAKLTASDAAAADLFGHSAAMGDNHAVVGAFADGDAGANSGSAYVYQRSGTSWSEQVKLTPSDASAGAQFGQAVSASGNFAFIGSPYEGEAASSAGAGYIYELDPPCCPHEAITVCWDGSGDYTTIQAGIDAAVNGDEVVVCDGTYTGAGNKALDFAGKAITLRSVSGPDKTIIDCQNDGRGFYFHSGEGPSSIVRGFTITNGSVVSTNDDGGAIYCIGSSPIITNCRFNANTAIFGAGIACDASDITLTVCSFSDNICDGGSGGGISCWNGSDATIAHCTFRGNWSMSGGGIRCYESDPTITGCTISGNYGGTGGGIYCNRSTATISYCTVSGNFTRGGGGVYCYLNSPTITNCTITGNSATLSGGGIYCSSNSPTITNCTVSGNFATLSGGGIRCYLASPTITNCTVSGNSAGTGGGVRPEDGSLTFTNGIVWGNLPQEVYHTGSGSPTIVYSDVQGGWPGAGNLNTDPRFVGGPGGTWTSDGVHDPATHEITFTDDTAAWSPHEWIGRLLNPDTTQARQLFVVANTTTTITALADWDTIDAGSSWVPSGASYQIHDYRLMSGFPPPAPASPCIDMGFTSALPPDAADLDDDGNTTEQTPIDLDANQRVKGCMVDMGPYEVQTPIPVGRPGDFDHDCDVDADDLAQFEACASGPQVPQTDPGCADALFDTDDDVDQSDFGIFQRCISGSDVPADPHCAD